MIRTRGWPAALLCLSSISACAPADGPLPVTQVASQPNCQHIDRGAHLVTYAQLAKIRGAQLIELSESPTEAARPLHLVAISLGSQPSPGYRVVARDISQSKDGSDITVRVELEDPPWDALRGQSTANPCLVLGFDNDGTLRRVRVENGSELLATVDLAAPSVASPSVQ